MTSALANRDLALLFLTTNRRDQGEPHPKTVVTASPDPDPRIPLADYYLPDSHRVSQMLNVS